MRKLAFGSLMAGCIGFGAAQAATVDTSAGHGLANRLCSGCHEIGDEPKPSFLYAAPSFREIVADPAVTELALRVFHRSAKESMPNFVLTPQQIDDLSAYMLSLRGR